MKKVFLTSIIRIVFVAALTGSKPTLPRLQAGEPEGDIKGGQSCFLPKYNKVSKKFLDTIDCFKKNNYKSMHKFYSILSLR
jgi:hypothetical protein